MNFGGTVHLNKYGVCMFLLFVLIFGLYITHNDIPEMELSKLGSTVNMKDLLMIATEFAIMGGDQVVAVRESSNLQIRSKGKTQEGANNPVTKADYNSHCVMYFGLKNKFPMLRVVSEEQTSKDKCGNLASANLNLQEVEDEYSELRNELFSTKDLTVWIDPLDATQEFTENLLEYVTTLVCIAYKGRPIAGIIHRPFGNNPKTSWAWINKGMSRDLLEYKKVKHNPTVVVSRSHSGTVENIVHEALGPNINIIKAGGAGYKVMQVVSGNASAYVHVTAIKKWDICAGEAVLTAIGGKMTTITNENIDYSENEQPVNNNGILATITNHADYAEKFHRVLDKESNLNL